jgi:hypothetical protein
LSRRPWGKAKTAMTPKVTVGQRQLKLRTNDN